MNKPKHISYSRVYFNPVMVMMGKKEHISIIFITILLLLISGCAQLDKRGPAIPDVSMFDLYVSDSSGNRLDEPIFARGDTVFFTLVYRDVHNFKPLEASNIQYEFSRLNRVGMDVHEGFTVEGLKFTNRSGNSTVFLNPGESVRLELTIPETDEKWDNIKAKTGSNQSVAFDLVIKIKDLKVPLNSNELMVQI